jgi:hypothetical protein
MNFERFFNTAINYFQNHHLVIIILIVGLFIFSTLKLKNIYKFLIFATIIGVIFYIMSQLGDSTSNALKIKDEMIYQTRKKDFNR